MLDRKQIEELLYQALETEIGGQKVYETAIRCAQHPDLKEEWEKYLDETREHERILRETFGRIGLDPEKATPGRAVVHFKGGALIESMEMALKNGGPAAAQLVAAECVVEAETKDHQNWEIIGKVAEELDGDEAEALAEAHEQVEDQEDEHLYHTMGWARELWFDSLGIKAVLPPPEEKKHVTTAIGAARAKQSRGEMTKSRRNGGSAHSPSRSRMADDPKKRGGQDRSRVSQQEHEQAYQRRKAAKPSASGAKRSAPARRSGNR